MARIHSIKELSEKTATIIASVASSKQPIYIEQNGSTPVALVDTETYLAQMQALQQFERIYQNMSEEQEISKAARIEAGRTV